MTSPGRPGHRRRPRARRGLRPSSTGWRNRGFDAGRGDFFYLADAFLHGRTWLDFPPGPYDVIIVDGRFYVPFAPFPAIALMPLVALIGAGHAPTSGSPGSTRSWPRRRRPVLVAARPDRRRRGCATGSGWRSCFGFSTQILWVTTRGGVWHTGHLVATILTFGCLIELWGRQRARADRPAGRRRVPDPGAAGVRDPVLRAAARRPPWSDASTRSAATSARAADPVARVGLAGRRRPARRSSSSSRTTRSASGRRSSPATRWRPCRRSSRPARAGPVLARPRPDEPGLLPASTCRSPIPTFPFFRPDGLGMSVLITSPGLLLRGPRRLARPPLLAAARARRSPS